MSDKTNKMSIRVNQSRNVIAGNRGRKKESKIRAIVAFKDLENVGSRLQAD